ncbi:hypothetical protein ACXR2U_17745 [Jatrophihabitans sp. YIM 134969]
MRRAKREITVAVDVATAAQRVRAAFTAMGARILEDGGAGRILARTGASGRSFGERVEVVLTPQGECTHVAVRAETVVGSTLFDWGSTRSTAEQVVATVVDEQLAASAEARAAERVLPAAAIWLGEVAVGVATVLAVVAARGHERTELLAAALTAAVLWAVAVLTGALRVRQRGAYQSPAQVMVPLVVWLPLGLVSTDLLTPPHPSEGVHFSAELSSVPGSFALVALLFAAYHHHRRRNRHRPTPG